MAIATTLRPNASAALWLALFVLICNPVQADIYSYVDEFGVRHLSNVPDDPRYRLVMRMESSRATPKATRNAYTAHVRTVAKALLLDPALIEAVIQAESAFDPHAESHKGAVGLMQLMPATAARYGVRDRRDPRQNIIGGARYLRDLLDEFRDLPLALAAYNAGEGAVRRYGNSIPPYQETQTYVRRVQDFYSRFRGF
jgi:soluble lytic murein transglycosylase-like protein